MILKPLLKNTTLVHSSICPAAAAVTISRRRQGLRCRERIRGLNSWAIYTHETRMVVVAAAAAPHSALSAWQFASHGIVHLPMFELQVS